MISKTSIVREDVRTPYQAWATDKDSPTHPHLTPPPYDSPSLTSNHIKVILASSLGTVFEWYDFFLYGSLASVIAKHFFTPLPSGSAFVMALFTFAAGFAVRPFGAIVFGRLGDMIGRKYTFLATIVIMGAATFLVGVLPTYATFGYAAPIILVLLRCLQGLAVGGEYGGAATYVAEHAPPGKRGFYTSFIQATASIGLLLSLLIIVICRSIMGEETFGIWGWRIPFLISVLLLGVSVFIRMKLHESPIFKEMKSSGKTSKSPLKDSFCNWKNLKIVILVLFGAVAGEGVVFYTSQFYALFFLTKTLKMDDVSANIYLGIALIFSTFCYIFFGWLSDKIGRKPIVLIGCLLAAALYYPLFMALTHFANPQLEKAMRENPAVVVAYPDDCAFQLTPGELKGHVKFTSSCDLLKNLLNEYSVSYSTVPAKKGTLAYVKIGNVTVHSVNVTELPENEAVWAQGNLTEQVKEAIIQAGYPLKADTAQVDKVLLEIMLIILTIFGTMAYGPLAAWMVELFPTKIRYTSMSLPYHLGNGWIGGFLPTVAFAVVLLTGNIYSGLWYPIIFSIVTVVVGALFLPETRHVDITGDNEEDRYECLPLNFIRDRFFIRQYNLQP